VAEAGWWERLIDPHHPPALGERCALAGLTLASGLYRGLALGHRFVAGSGAWCPPVPTLCIGNITVGGTGKTTVARFLAREILHRRLRVAVILRGYGRAGAAEQAVAHDGTRLVAGPREVGDEAAMLGASLERAVVLVGPSRVASARRAVEEFGAEVLILDDGLQHWKIAPHLRVALWDATQDPREARLFPRGRLREPLSSLREMDIVLLTRFDVSPRAEQALALLRELRETRPVVCARHRPVRLDGPEGRVEAPEALRGRRVFAISSLGNPSAFRLTLEQLGAEIVGEVVFPDHHLYTREELDAVRESARAAGAEEVLATEKDHVKLNGLPGAEAVTSLVVDLEILAPPHGDGPEAWVSAVSDGLAATNEETV
jgi:tetraacyldisaccharide 4'-kinase